MSSLKNDRFLRALARQPVDMTPIWIMRQAGRYLPEYRATRAQAGSFMQLCKTPELACEVTLQPLRRYDLDAAIIFSDILTIPDAMGLGLHFIEGEGPQFSSPVQDEQSIKRLSVPDPEQLDYVYEAIRLVQRSLDHRLPLIGFSGSPWTLAAYMIEGKAKHGFNLALAMLEQNPTLLHKLLETLSQSVALHLNMQIEAGVQAVMIFDTWGGLLNTAQYEAFSLFYLQKIILQLSHQYHKETPVILFTKGGALWLEQLSLTGAAALGVDWETDLHRARALVGERVALQGNLDPACLLTSASEIEAGVAQTLSAFGKGEGHIFNLGHGITPDVPVEHVQALVEAVHRLSQPYHE